MAAVACFLALVLATAAAHKALQPARLSAAAARLAGVAPPSASLLLVLAGAIEAVAALCLLLPGTHVAGAAIAAAVWSAYALALWRRRGEVLDCGCDLTARPRPVSTGQVARAAVLAALAIAVAALPALTGGFGTDLVAESLAMTVLAAIGLFALYLATSEILTIPEPAWRNS